MLIALVVLVVLAVAIVGIYNGIVRKHLSVKNAWSQIEVQLKRRHDLIPNLVETVKGYAKHESETMEKVIAARNAAVTATRSGNVAEASQAEGALTGMLRQVFAVAEAYPDLKANQNFLQLQEEITSTENRIGFSRQHYNDSVEIYNAAIQQIPGNLVASFGGFKTEPFFELSLDEKTAVQTPPKVSF